MEPQRIDGSVPSAYLPYTVDHRSVSNHVAPAFSFSSIPAVCGPSSPSSSSNEVVTPHVDVVVCTCADRQQDSDHHYSEASTARDVAEVTPLSASVVNMDDSIPCSHPLPPVMMMAPSTPPPAYCHFPIHPQLATAVISGVNYAALPCSPVLPPIDNPGHNQNSAISNAYDPLIHSSYSLASSSVTVNQLQRVVTGGGLCVSADLLTTSTAGPVCRICHLPNEENKQLISPCRCAGTLQYIHNACLVKWLEICMKKYRQRVPRCELCNFEYIRRKRFRFRGWRCPSVSRRDRVLHFIFLISLFIMLACAVITIQLFMAEKESKLTNSGHDSDQFHSGSPNSGNNLSPSKVDDGSGAGRVGGSGVGGMPGGAGVGSQTARMSLSWEEAVTLGCGVTFFVAFFLAMTAQIKARRTVYQLITKCFASNLIWEIQEYVPELDKSLQKRRAAAANMPCSSRQQYATVERGNDASKRAQQQTLDNTGLTDSL